MYSRELDRLHELEQKRNNDIIEDLLGQIEDLTDRWHEEVAPFLEYDSVSDDGYLTEDTPVEIIELDNELTDMIEDLEIKIELIREEAI